MYLIIHPPNKMNMRVLWVMPLRLLNADFRFWSRFRGGFFAESGPRVEHNDYDGAGNAIQGVELHMPKMFGTDGVRGLANRDLTARLALDLGDAAVCSATPAPKTISLRGAARVGRDTRVSGDFLASALSAGMPPADST